MSMMVMMMVMMLMLLILVIVIVMMMVVAFMLLVVVLIVVMMVVVAFLLLILVLIVVMMVVALVLLVLIIVVIVMVVMAAALPVLVVMMMVVVMCMLLRILSVGHFLCLFHHLRQQIIDLVRALDRGQHVLAVELIERRCYDRRLRIVLTDQSHRFLDLLIGSLVRAAQDDRPCVCDLVDEELAEVLDIHLGLGGIHDSDRAVDLYVQIRCDTLDRLQDIGKLADTGGLDQDPLGSVGGDHFLQGSAKVTDQAAADASLAHFLDLDTGILQKSAIDGDLAEFILDQHRLAAVHSLSEKLFDQCGFTRPQETGKYINLCHFLRLLSSTFETLSILIMSGTISRVLSCVIIYLVRLSPAASSDLPERRPGRP